MYEDIIYEDHALVLVAIPETDVNLLSSVFCKVDGVFCIFTFESLGSFSDVQLICFYLTFALHPANDVRGQGIDILIACPNHDIQLVTAEIIVVLSIKGERTELVRDCELWSNHPVVALPLW